MKAKYISFFLILIVFVGCDPLENEPNPTRYTVTTNNATAITNSTANISYSMTPLYSGESGINVSKNPQFNNSMEFRGDNNDSFSVNATGLEKNTTYYYRAFIGGIYDEYVYGNVLSFTTKDLSASITTGTAYQTEKSYSSAGFIEDGMTYHYRYNWTASYTVISADKFSECGIHILNTYFSSSFKEGNNNLEMIIWSNSSSVNISYYAFGKLNNGTFLYGSSKTVRLSY